MRAEEMAIRAEGKIRRLRAEDAPALVSIAAAARGAAEWSTESYKKLSLSAESVSFVHESGKQITGFILARKIADEAELLNLAVRAENRKRGVGGGLLQAVLEELRRKGIARIYLEVRASNTEARNFYMHHGFRVAGARPMYYREPDEAAVLMEKKLTG